MTQSPTSISPDVLSGTPVFYGTRVPIKNLFDYLKTGETLDEFLTAFPTVTRQQVVDVLELAEKLLLANTDGLRKKSTADALNEVLEKYKDVYPFQDIDPVEWQRQIRSEWNRDLQRE